MSENRTVKCDSCYNDLTYTGNSVGYRIVVDNQPIPSYPKFSSVTDMMIYPPIKEGPLHFCGLKCLRMWFMKEDK